jgi:GNAT superfamily N-acetyltransferase
MTAAFSIDVARVADAPWLIAADSHVPEAWVRRCIGHEEYFMAKDESGPIGFLRYSWFWGGIPFMDLIWVDPAHRRAGVGRALVAAWAAAMAERGAKVLMTSSMSDEPEPQAWHRANGFIESGQLTFGSAQPTPEVFFVREL